MPVFIWISAYLSCVVLLHRRLTSEEICAGAELVVELLSLTWFVLGLGVFGERPPKAMKSDSTHPAVSSSCLSNNRTMAQCQRCRVSGATGANDYTPTPHGWNKN